MWIFVVCRMARHLKSNLKAVKLWNDRPWFCWIPQCRICYLDTGAIKLFTLIMDSCTHQPNSEIMPATSAYGKSVIQRWFIKHVIRAKSIRSIQLIHVCCTSFHKSFKCRKIFFPEPFSVWRRKLSCLCFFCWISLFLLKAIAVSANKYMYRANMHVYGRYLYDIYVYRKKCSSSYRNIHTMQEHRQWYVHWHSKLKHIESVVFAMLSRRPIPNSIYSPTGYTYTTLRMFVHNAPIFENFSASLSLIFACKKESQVIIS